MNRKMEACLLLFRQSGERVDTTTAPSLSLQDQNAIWFLEKGNIDLFVERKSLQPSRHNHVKEFSAPSLLFFLEPLESFSFSLSTRSTSLLWKMSYLDFQKWAENPENASLISFLVYKWVNDLSEIFKKPEISPTHFLHPFSSLSLKANETFEIKAHENPEQKFEIQWIKVEKGALAFPPFPKIRISSGQIFPLLEQIPLQALDDCVLACLPATSLFLSHAWHQRLVFFHACFSRYLKSHLEEEEELRRKQIFLKKEKELENLDEALHQIASTLEPAASFSVERGDDLFKACQIIGSTLGFSFTAPVESSFDSIDAQISTLCRISSIRFRKVSLKSEWWKKDSGPLLGFWGSERKPVALLPKQFGYQIVDPHDREHHIRKIDKSNESRLDPFAYTFYAPLSLTKKKGLRILTHNLSKYKTETFALLFSGILFGLVSLFQPIATRMIFDHILPSKSLEWLAQVFFALIASSISLALFFAIRSLSTLRLEGKIGHHLQSGFWDYLLKLPVHFFREFSYGDLFNRVSAVEQIHKLISGHAAQILISGLFSFFYVLIMFFYSPFLSFLTLLFYLIGFSITFFCLAKRSKIMKSMLDLKGAINGTLLQIITGVGKLRVASAEMRAFSHWALHFSKLAKLQLKLQSLENISLVANAILPSLISTVIFAGYIFVLRKPNAYNPSGIAIGAFLGFYTAFTMLSLIMRNVSSTLFTLSPIYYLWKRGSRILEAEPEPVISQEKPEVLTGDFSLDHISFRYNSKGSYTLDDISITGNPGEFIGIAGESGCGKSTLISLLLGFEKPEKGVIYFNGKELQKLDIRGVRNQMGVVLQNDTLLTGTLYDNILCGRTFSKAQVEKALELSTFSSDISSFPMGLHTVLSAAGQTLSGGQKQKLLIARALIGNPKILIFDEATSGLDNASQDEISKNIAALNMTRICVAHRLSTIKNADRIYLIDKGRVVETGTFDELIKLGGAFYRLLERQKL